MPGLWDGLPCETSAPRRFALPTWQAGLCMSSPHPAGWLPPATCTRQSLQHLAEDSAQLCRDPDVAESRCSHAYKLPSCCQGGNCSHSHAVCLGVGATCQKSRAQFPTPEGLSCASLQAFALRSPVFRQAMLTDLSSKCWRFAISAHYFTEFDEVLKCGISHLSPALKQGNLFLHQPFRVMAASPCHCPVCIPCF